MRLEKIIIDFRKNMDQLDYVSAAENIGQMKLLEVEDVLLYEAELLFVTQQFERIVTYFHKKYYFEDEDFDEKYMEFVAAAYSNLHRHYESYSVFCEMMNPCDYYCYEYCKMLALRDKATVQWNRLGFEEREGSFWQRKFLFFITDQVADIYIDNEHILDLEDANEDKNEIQKLRNNIEERIDLFYSYYPTTLIMVRNLIHSRKPFPRTHIVAMIIDNTFPALKINHPSSLDEFHDCLSMMSGYDMLSYLSIEFKVAPLTAFRDMSVYMSTGLQSLLDKNCKLAANTVLQIINHIKYASSDELDDIDGVQNKIEIWEKCLKDNHFQTFFEESSNEIDSKIIKGLSLRGRALFKSAQWQLHTLLAAEGFMMDAGMLSLSFMRIIELEINERIIKRFKPFIAEVIAYKEDVIRDVEFNKRCDKERKVELIDLIEDRWEVLLRINELEENSGLEMGSLGWFFNNFIGQPKEVMRISRQVEAILRDNHILTSKGVTALKQRKKAENELEQFRFVDMTDKKRRMKYRNPPAHTRYVSSETALECVNYVRAALLKIDEYTFDKS